MEEERRNTPPMTPPAPRVEVQWEGLGRAVHPSLDFDLERRLAFVCLPLPLREGEGGGKARVIKPYLVVVGNGIRNCIPLEIVNVPLECEPCFLEMQSRWPQSHLKAFLNGTAPAATGTEVFETVEGLINKYVDLPEPAQSRILAAFVMMTYIFPAMPTCSYLKIGGQRGSGKTRLASILSMLCHNALHTSSLTPASIFRVTQNTRCTLIADEMENLTRNNGLSMLLNSGYKRSSVVVRAGAKGKLELFQSYGPKVIASIEPLNEVLASRTITVHLTPTRDAAKARLNVTETAEDWGQVRGMLYGWAMTHGIAAASTALPEDVGVSNRLLEIWAPLLQVASSLEPQKQGVTRDLMGYAVRSATPAVPPIVLSDADRLLVMALTRLTANGAATAVGTTDILAAMRTVDPAAVLPSRQNVGFAMERLRLFRSRRHTAVGRRFTLDITRIADLAGQAC